MKRQLYSKLLQWKESINRKPLILKGARQVGKTWILRKFGQEAFPGYHYINFEEDDSLLKIFEKDLNPKRIVDELSFYVNKQINPNEDLLIFDEIQSCPRALTSLKYFNEKMPELAICSAGSLLGITLGESAFPVGKVEFFEMYPMCFQEFLEASNDIRSVDFLENFKKDESIPEIIHTHLWQQMKIFFVTGGLPEIVRIYADNQNDLFTALSLVRNKQGDLVKAYIADIAKHSGKINAMHIERVLNNVPSQLAREHNGSASKFRFKDVVPGIQGYSRLAGPIHWLTAAGLVHKINIANSGLIPLSAYTNENRFKLFMFDTGILGAISNLFPKTILDYDYGTYKGYFAENFIAQELICAGKGPLHSWNERTAEVEFLIESQGRTLPVEVKSGWVTKAKSLKVFAEKYKPEYRTVMSGRNFKIDHKNGIHNYPLYLASFFPLY